MFYRMEPQWTAALSIGGRAKVQHPALSNRCPQVVYESDRWIGDDLLTGGGLYVGTLPLAMQINSVWPPVTGLKSEPVFAEKSPEQKLAPTCHESETFVQLPSLFWLRITGRAGREDFGLDDAGRLVISSRVFDTFSALKLRRCVIEECKDGILEEGENADLL